MCTVKREREKRVTTEGKDLRFVRKPAQRLSPFADLISQEMYIIMMMMMMITVVSCTVRGPNPWPYFSPQSRGFSKECTGGEMMEIH